VSPEPAHAAFRVRHHYRYVYTGPIRDIKQRLIMIPPDRHADQALLSFDLEVRGTSGGLDIDWQTDVFGNRVCRVEAERVEHALDFEARFTVTRNGASAAPPPAESHDFLRSYTGLTAPDARIRAAAQTIGATASSDREAADLAHDWSAQAITYQVGVTGTQTPAAMALHLGFGVCQDYAHIMLSLLRTLGLPARYVSGHLIGEGAPHAWVEVFMNSAEPPAIVAYDPTHHRLATHNYITVAVGRDFSDVTTTSGVFSGAATGKLHWSKHAERIHLPGSKEVAEAVA
jgi:transglutaminase-like putative cysteine protease